MANPRVGERLEVFQGADGKWRYRKVAANNEKMDPSQAYADKDNAITAATHERHGGTPVFVQDQLDGGWRIYEKRRGGKDSDVDDGFTQDGDYEFPEE